MEGSIEGSRQGGGGHIPCYYLNVLDLLQGGDNDSS